MIQRVACFLFLGAVAVAFSGTRNVRPQVGEKQDSAVTPNAPTGPQPRNVQDEIYRGPPSNWDQGRVIVDVQSSSAPGNEHNKEKPEVKK